MLHSLKQRLWPQGTKRDTTALFIIAMIAMSVSGIGKAFLYKAFFQYAKFIAIDLTGPFVGVISSTTLVVHAKASHFTFIRLVGW